MESYTYLFLFVFQLVFAVAALIVLLHVRRLRHQLEKKNRQLLTELQELRGQIQSMKDTYSRFTGKIVCMCESTTTIKEIGFSNRKTEKRAGEHQSQSYRDHKETTSRHETAVTRTSDFKQQSQEKEKTANGCSLWTFLKFMFFFLSFCLVHDNWASIKNFIRRLWNK